MHYKRRPVNALQQNQKNDVVCSSIKIRRKRQNRRFQNRGFQPHRPAEPAGPPRSPPLGSGKQWLVFQDFRLLGICESINSLKPPRASNSPQAGYKTPYVDLHR